MIEIESLDAVATQVASRSVAVDITLFTDPACPFAFSAEPVRQRLRWHYGDQLRWRLTMIVLTLEPGEDAKLAEGAPGLQRRYGMPIDPVPYARTFSSEPACRAVVATRLNAPGAEAPLLRALRVRAMLGGLLDDPSLLAAAARDVGLDPEELARWSAMPAAEDTLRADIESARSPSRAARALDAQARRTARAAPLHGAELRADQRRADDVDPRLQPVRGLRERDRQPRPGADAPPEARIVEALLEWATEPLATAEIIAIMQRDPALARAALSRAAKPIAAGADFYWTL